MDVENISYALVTANALVILEPAKRALRAIFSLSHTQLKRNLQLCTPADKNHEHSELANLWRIHNENMAMMKDADEAGADADESKVEEQVSLTRRGFATRRSCSRSALHIGYLEVSAVKEHSRAEAARPATVSKRRKLRRSLARWAPVVKVWNCALHSCAVSHSEWHTTWEQLDADAMQHVLRDARWPFVLYIEDVAVANNVREHGLSSLSGEVFDICYCKFVGAACKHVHERPLGASVVGQLLTLETWLRAPLGFHVSSPDASRATARNMGLLTVDSLAVDVVCACKTAGVNSCVLQWIFTSPRMLWLPMWASDEAAAVWL